MDTILIIVFSACAIGLFLLGLVWDRLGGSDESKKDRKSGSERGKNNEHTKNSKGGKDV